MDGSFRMRNRPTAFPPGWMEALWCVHRYLGWTNLWPFYYLFADLDMCLPVQWLGLFHWWAGVCEALVLASWDDLVHSGFSCLFIWQPPVSLEDPSSSSDSDWRGDWLQWFPRGLRTAGTEGCYQGLALSWSVVFFPPKQLQESIH